MAFLPATFAINPDFDVKNLQEDITKITHQVNTIDILALKTEDSSIATELRKDVTELQSLIALDDPEKIDRQNIRRNILKIQKNYKTLSTKQLSMIPSANASE